MLKAAVIFTQSVLILFLMLQNLSYRRTITSYAETLPEIERQIHEQWETLHDTEKLAKQVMKDGKRCAKELKTWKEAQKYIESACDVNGLCGAMR